MNAGRLAAIAGAMSVSLALQVRAACPELTGRWGMGQVAAVATAGDRAYVGSGTVLLVLDISAPVAPVVLGQVLLPGEVHGIAANGSYLYVADYTGGLRTVDATDPARPVDMGSATAANRVEAVAVSGSHAYFVSASHFTVLDLADPAHPAQVGATTFAGSGYGVAVTGGYAFVAAGTGDLQVIDVSTPGAPAVVGSLALPGSAEDLVISGSLACVAALDGDLQIVNIAQPTAPAVIGALATAGTAYDVALSGSHLLVAADREGVRVVDVTVPAGPVEVGWVDTPGNARGVAVAASVAFVADRSEGLRVLNVGAPATPSEVNHLTFGDEARDVAIAGDRAYVADQLAGLRILGIADATAPVELGFLDTDGDARGVDVVGSYAYVADGAKLLVVDVTAPGSPTQVGAANIGSAEEVAVAGGYAYVARGWFGITVVDVSTPASPAKVVEVNTPDDARDIALAGNFAFIATDGAGLTIYDVSSPAAPLLVGTADTPTHAYGVAVAGSYAYVADIDSGLRVVDVSDPTHPVEVAGIDTTNAKKVAVADDRLFLADAAGGVRVYSLADPAAPEEVGVYETAGTASGVAAAGDLVAVADGSAGAAFFAVSDCPATLCSLTCSVAADPAGGPAPLVVAFSATVTAELCSAPVAFRWQLGDGSPDATEQAFSHTYAAGSFPWTVTATSGAASCSQSGTITAAAPGFTVLDGATVITSGQTTPVEFGAIVQGSAGAPRIFTVRNDGLAPVALGQVVTPAGFVVAEGLSPVLAAGASEHFTVRLDTATAGERSGTLTFTTDVPGQSPFSFPVQGTVGTPPPRRFDFGTATSDVAASYTRATATSAYTSAVGWGWLPATLTARDRGNAFSGLDRDFVYSSDATFVVDLPNGAWDVTVTMGDGTYAHDQMGVSLEGALAATLTTGAGQFVTRPLHATVSDSQLTVRFRDLGGSDPAAVINGLSITPAPPFRFDFGTATSPVAAGYTRVTETTLYGAFQAYGWGAGAVQSRNRTSGNDLTRDLNFATGATFLADIADGAYDVTVVMGDATMAHDQMGVAFESGAFASVTTKAAQWSAKTYRVTVGDGQLTVLLDDLGGTDPNVVINALMVAPASYRFDFGTATSPVASGFTQVTGGMTYNAARGYGWLSGTVAARDRAAGSDLLRDLNFTTLATFAVDVPAGSWDVTISIADAKVAHDQMGFSIEDTSVGTYALLAGESRVVTSRIAVADGQVTLLLDDLGGTDPNVVISGLELQPVAP